MVSVSCCRLCCPGSVLKGICKQLFIKPLGNLSIYLRAHGRIHFSAQGTSQVDEYSTCTAFSWLKAFKGQGHFVPWLFLDGICLPGVWIAKGICKSPCMRHIQQKRFLKVLQSSALTSMTRDGCPWYGSERPLEMLELIGIEKDVSDLEPNHSRWDVVTSSWVF